MIRQREGEKRDETLCEEQVEKEKDGPESRKSRQGRRPSVQVLPGSGGKRLKICGANIIPIRRDEKKPNIRRKGGS